MPSLSDQLKSLGVQLGARDLPPPQPRRAAHAIDQIVPGRFAPTSHGPIFLTEQFYPPDYRHGQAAWHIPARREVVAKWAGEPRLAQAVDTDFVFLDTETTGLAGGTGTYAFMVGIGRVEADRFRLIQFFMQDPQEEPALLAALTDFVAPCTILVTFNGKSYDAPLLNSRYILNGQASPLEGMAHLDLLPLARRLWRDYLPSRSLSYLEEHILRFSRTQEDIPGWLIPSVYFEYLRHGDARPLKSIFYHNAVDILAMAGLLNHINHMLTNPLTDDLAHPLELAALARLFESLNHFDTANQLYRYCLTAGLPEPHFWNTLERLSMMHKRQGDLSAAVRLWQQAAEGRQIYAHVELAKFHEHRQADFVEALRWTEAALDCINTTNCPPAIRQHWRAELKHRQTRLQRKLTR